MTVGNIYQVDTTGASEVTSSADHLQKTGVAASRAMAQHDLPEMNKYKWMIEQAGREEDVDPAIIAGIISRETRAGTGIATTGGYGYDGHGFGLMQVDDRWHKIKGGAYSYDNILQGTQIFKYMITRIHELHPSWTANEVLKGAIAAYNCGAGNVTSYADVDARTTGKDYSNDVVARAQFFKENGY